MSGLPSRRLGWLLLAITLVGVMLVRLRWLGVPLERDEGEFAYVGQLIQQGIPPYKLAYNMKLPGTYVAYAALMAIFGQTPQGVHLGLLVVNAIAIVLVYALARRLTDPVAAGAAAAVYGVMTLGVPVLGFAGHATQFVVPCALAGLLLLARTDRPPRAPEVVASGVAIACALLAKQPGAVFALPALVLLARPLDGHTPDSRELVRNGALFAGGLAVPLALTAAWLAIAGVFDRFWFWTVTYAAAYGTEASLHDGLVLLGQTLSGFIAGEPLLLIVAALSAALVALRARDRRTLFAGALGLASLASVSVGLYFRPHYFVVLVPFLALTIALAIAHAPRLHRAARSIVLAAVAVAILEAVWAQGDDFFRRSPVGLSRHVYGNNPFPESEEVARYIAAHSGPEARVAVLGSEPQVYFLSNRKSATGYLYMYGLMEKQPYAAEMQRDMIREIETGKPEYVVVVVLPASWLTNADSPTLLPRWLNRYVPEHYEIVGLIDISSHGSVASRAHWDADARTASPTSSAFIQVGRRLPGK